MTAGDPADLEPTINRRPLPPSIARARRVWDARAEADEARRAPTVERRIVAAQAAIDALALIHSEIVDNTDIELDADTRWVAVLLVTARCIALADALLDLVRSGYGGEVAGTARVLHEGLDLALALASGNEHELRLWLQGKQYPTKIAKRARTQFFKDQADRIAAATGRPFEDDPRVREHTEALEAAGEDLSRGLFGLLHTIGGQTYGNLSAMVHLRRDGIGEVVAPRLRRFVYGPHPDPGVRSRYVELADGLVEQTVLDVAAALSELVGFDAIGPRAARVLNDLRLVRERASLS